jgi:DNA-binding transcriptional LysR family regulator
MELRHLRYFVAVAEELNVRRAAERLRVSQPPLSRQIHDLEDEVGAKLFVRMKAGMRLTKAGEYFLKEARQILSQSQRAVQTALAASRGEAGHLEIAYTPTVFDPEFPRVMRIFQKCFPLVELRIRELFSQEQTRGLLEKQIDLGYVAFRYPELEKELTFKCVRRADMYVALPPHHPLCRKRQITLRALANEGFVSVRRLAPAFHSWVTELCGQAGFIPKIAYDADSPLSLLGSVAAGIGVALVPETGRHFQSVDVKFRRLPASVPKMEFYIAWRKDNDSPVLRTFLEMLMKQMQRKELPRNSRSKSKKSKAVPSPSLTPSRKIGKLLSASPSSF